MIGQDIQQMRLVNKLSQEALGSPQFSGAYVSRVENGLQEPSQRFLSHVATRLPYRNEQFYQLGYGHLMDSVMHLAQILHEMGKWEIAWSLASQSVDIAHQSGDPLIISWARGFQLMLHPDPDPRDVKHFWEMVRIVDWNQANAEAAVRFVKLLGKLPVHILSGGGSPASTRQSGSPLFVP